MPPDLAVETDGLTRDFGSFRAVDAVALAVPAGSLYGFLGPNGAGKSTTIKCLTGLLRPTAGTIRILGIDPLADPVAVKRRIGVVPEDLALFDRLTAQETLSFVAQVHGIDAATARQRSADLLERHGPEDVRDDARHRFFPRHAQEAVAGGGAAAGAEAALPRRAVRGDRCGRVPADQGPAAVVRGARRHDLPDVAHPRNRRAAVDAHRRHREREDGGAGLRSASSAPAAAAARPSRSCSSAWSAATRGRRWRSTGSDDVEDPARVRLAALAHADQLDREDRRARHARAVFPGHREARPDHGRRPDGAVGAGAGRARRRRRLRARARRIARRASSRSSGSSCSPFRFSASSARCCCRPPIARTRCGCSCCRFRGARCTSRSRPRRSAISGWC